jgi:hypothetical protein
MEETDKDKVKALLERGLSRRKIAEEMDSCVGSVVHWMKKWGLETHRGPRGELRLPEGVTHVCSCGQTDPSAFYPSQKRTCKVCQNRYTIGAQHHKRDRIISFLGGKCLICGFNTYKSALDVHHKDPSKKDPDFHQIRGWKWERIERELQGCVLLCANCHRGVHSNDLSLPAD